MGSCCARCMKFGEWKKYKKSGTYKGRPLCPMCRMIISKPRKVKSENTKKC